MRKRHVNALERVGFDDKPHASALSRVGAHVDPYRN